MTEKIDLYSMLPSEIEAYLVSLGEPKFRAKQLFPRLQDGTPITEISNLPKALREKLAAETLQPIPTVEKKLVSRIDGTIKYLFRLHDGECIESVLMKDKHGNTHCISSQ
ncbi:MAG: 23S rRNA (adenine(2503)-C(2))-methyltransferase RlmN, partial [Clostridia bacterium]|nr:23S rRNA (adenine(2503)-C(2))-methyltransferase RlmN [Clostridia bacterium]